MATRILKIGDPCPGCDGELVKARQPTDAERARAKDRDNPVPLPPHYDTAPAEDVAELGPLYRCPHCDYKHRFGPEKAKGKSASSDS